MKILRSFLYAWNGIFHCIRKERNFKVHLFITVIAVLLAVLLNINLIEWCILLICMGLVLGMEMMNTAIEQLSDKMNAGYDRIIGVVKDISAGAVLITATIAALCGSIIFLPKIILYIQSL
jgi:diacylglycerol kinase (ATP)